MEVIKPFLTYLAGDRGYSPRTVATYHDCLTHFQAYFSLKGREPRLAHPR